MVIVDKGELSLCKMYKEGNLACAKLFKLIFELGLGAALRDVPYK